MTTLSLNRYTPAAGDFVPPARKNAASTATSQVPTIISIATSIFAWVKSKKLVRSTEKRLQISETLSLGEKRFVAIVKVDGREFLIGGADKNVSILNDLGPAKSFAAALASANAPKARTRALSKSATHKLMPAVAAKLVQSSTTKSAAPRKRKTLTAQTEEQA